MNQSKGSIEVRVDGSVGTILIDRPGRANALSRRLVDSLHEKLDDFHSAGRVRAVILTGVGSTFCSGSDLLEIQQAYEEDSPFEIWQRDSQLLLDLILKMLRFPKPIVAAVNGDAVGSGVALVLACDVVVASQEASLCVPEARRGLSPGPTLPLLSFRLGTSVAARLLFTADSVDAEVAEKTGAVSRIGPK